jgi:hypothetical protein
MSVPHQFILQRAEEALDERRKRCQEQIHVCRRRAEEVLVRGATF